MSNNQIEDITLIKCLGKGSFGEVFLSTKRGKRELFATKKIDRVKADQPSFKKYFENEIKILNSLRHPNIVKLEDIKATKDSYYIVMEYINGGSLTDCLKQYQKITGKAFPENILQYLMRQIVDAIKYIHQQKIIHRDLKLDNIMVNFDNENDKNNLYMMRAKIKIIDFGFAIQLAKSDLAFSALGSPINMDPFILRKYTNKGGNINQLGYDSKADIWSLGTICYEMLIGQAVFNAETMNELIKKVENGSYNIPTNVSKEVVSFLNGMLQYNSEMRLSAEELSKHEFLTKNVRDFTRIDTKKAQKKIDNKGLNINIKQNQTIWAIFNKEDEEKLVNIRGGRDLPAPEGPIGEDYIRKVRTEKKSSKNNSNNNKYQKTNSGLGFGQYPSLDNSFYGQKMHPNTGGNNAMPMGMKQVRPGMQNIPRIQQYPGMQSIPQMQQYPGMPPISREQNLLGIPIGLNMNNYPTFGIYPPAGAMYPPNNMPNAGYISNNPNNLNAGRAMYPPNNMPNPGYFNNKPNNLNTGKAMYPPSNMQNPGYFNNKPNNFNGAEYKPINNDDEDGGICNIQ